MKTAFALLIGIACSFSVTVRAEDATDDKSRLQGEWVLLTGETNGRSLGEVMRKRGLPGLTIKFSDDLMTMAGAGAPDHTYQFTLKPTDRPGTIKLVTVETNGKAPKGSLLHGIYKIEDDKLTLCLPSDSAVGRPSKFEAPSGSRLSKLVLRRRAEVQIPGAEPSDEPKSR